MKTLAIDLDGTLTRHQFDFNSSEEKLLTTPIMQGSQDAMQTLKKSFNIKLVTSRPVSVKMPTVHWTNQYFGIKGVIFTPEKTPKTTGADILIDDRLENIEKFIKEGGSGILFLRAWSLGDKYKDLQDFLKNTPEELRQAGIEKRFFVANGWSSVLDLVKRVE